jgi:hypothetical protein
MLGSITDGQDQIEEPDSSEANDSSSMAKRTSSFAATTSAEDFVVVDRQSAIESMAFFIAETLMSCPQAASLPPDKLQEAVLIAVQVKIYMLQYGAKYRMSKLRVHCPRVLSSQTEAK